MVVVTGTEAPGVGLRVVIVVNCAGICTTTVPVCPTTVGVAMVEVMGTEAPGAVLKTVVVVNGGGI
jgi:hypothetical protein